MVCTWGITPCCQTSPKDACEDGTPKYENTNQYALLKKEWLQNPQIQIQT
ncbi:hypothetical protein GNQ08_13060 [Paenibacillus macerans]|uniref:Uncharacterized protein n=1 Tax=Paenibacillus macerans TaxID=44252 RepID=A0A6N8ETT8_PAEMA|nr:hypothetical protein [Paenibacillus macerans]